MPLISVNDVASHVRLGLWSIADTWEGGGTLLAEARRLFSSERRQREYVCVRLLLRQMTGAPTPDIIYERSGRPRLSDGSFIGISHTRGMCCVAISDACDVAVDIEYVSGRVEKVSGYFLREDETAADITSLLIHWCAKETVYKLFPEDALSFRDIRVMGEVSADSGATASSLYDLRPARHVTARNERRGVNVEIKCCVTPDFVLTYAYVPCAAQSATRQD